MGTAYCLSLQIIIQLNLQQVTKAWAVFADTRCGAWISGSSLAASWAALAPAPWDQPEPEAASRIEC